MTKDEIMKLTDKELRIKAAELGGWKRIDDRPSHWPEGTPMRVWFTGQTFQPHKGPWWCPPDVLVEQCPVNGLKIPDYPDDIAAAMDLALSIGDKCWMELHTPFRVGDPFFCWFHSVGHEWMEWTPR